MASLQPELSSTIETKEIEDTTAVDLVKESRNDSLEQGQADPVVRSVTDDGDQNIINLSDNAPISEKNDPSKSTEEQKNHDEIPERNDEPVAKVDESVARVDEPVAKVDEALVKVDEPGVKVDEPGVKVDEAIVNEPVVKVDEAVAKVDESEAKVDEADAMIDEPMAKVDESKAKVDESEAKVDEADAMIDEPMAKVDESKVKVDESEAKVDEPVATIDEPMAKVDESKAKVDESEAKVDEPVTTIDEPMAKVDEHDATKDPLTQNTIVHSKASMLSDATNSSPAVNIALTNQQNGASKGYMESYNKLGGNVQTTVDDIVPSSVYRDYSRLPCAEGDSSLIGTSPSGKEPPFPVKLHKILSKLEFTDVVSWLPHGRSWRVLKPKAFEEKVVPLYFRHAKYASFMRQVNGWGFKRMTQGPDHNSYYHELFLRGLPHLCLKMRRPARAKPGSTDSDINPDFYRLSMVAPLPNPSNSVVKEMMHGDQGAIQSNAFANLANFQSSVPLLQGHGLPGNGLTNINLTNLGMNGLNAANLSTNMLIQQQIQNQFQQRFGNVGQQLGYAQRTNATCNALGGLDANNQMTQDLQQRKEDLVRQLEMMNNGNMNGKSPSTTANEPAKAQESGGQTHTSNQTSTSQTNLPSKPSDQHSLLTANVGTNTAQLQHMMMSQLQAAGTSGSDGNIAPQQLLGSMDMGSGGIQQLDLSKISSVIGGNGIGHINPQLLIQHKAMSNALGVTGINNSFTPSALGGLGLIMQNQILPNHQGSFQPTSNENLLLNGQGNSQLPNENTPEMKCESNGNSHSDNK